jgi:hypothetical protein
MPKSTAINGFMRILENPNLPKIPVKEVKPIKSLSKEPLFDRSKITLVAFVSFYHLKG